MFFRYQQGKVQVNRNRFCGYTKDDDGHLIIDPEQAEIVKRIYREYLKGSSMDKITDGLWLMVSSPALARQNGAPAPSTRSSATRSTWVTPFFRRHIPRTLTKKRIKNTGTVSQYYVEGNHEVIIPKELFMQVQAELVRRRDGSAGDLICLYKRDGHFAFASAYLSLPHQFGMSSFNVTVFRCSKSSIISIFSFSSFN